MDTEMRDVDSPIVIPLHRQLQSSVGAGSSTYGPVIASYSRRDSFVAGG